MVIKALASLTWRHQSSHNATSSPWGLGIISVSERTFMEAIGVGQGQVSLIRLGSVLCSFRRWLVTHSESLLLILSLSTAWFHSNSSPSLRWVPHDSPPVPPCAFLNRVPVKANAVEEGFILDQLEGTVHHGSGDTVAGA